MPVIGFMLIGQFFGPRIMPVVFLKRDLHIFLCLLDNLPALEILVVDTPALLIQVILDINETAV